MDEITKIIENLLHYPEETLDIEIKNYLDLNEEEKKADLAKELIALANHGGGFLIFGFDEDKSNGSFRISPQPHSLKFYTQDHINSIVEKYADPNFHCRLYTVKHPDSGTIHPIINVPGGHVIPIHAKRDGPDNKHIRKLACYIRRAGGRSETPQNSGEWQVLLQRCVRNNQAELLNAIRGVVTGNVSVNNSPSIEDRLDGWVKTSLQAWKNKVSGLPNDSPARLQNGYFMVAFTFTDFREPIEPAQLIRYTRSSSSGISGWPPFVTLNKVELEPYFTDDLIEAFIDPKDAFPWPHTSDFWRVSPLGMGFSVRGYYEDSPEHSTPPGRFLDPRVRTRLAAEYLIFIEKLGTQLLSEQGEIASDITIQFQWTGLSNRELHDFSGVGAHYINRVARTEQVTYTQTIELNSLRDNLTEVVQTFMEYLFKHFSLFSADPLFYKQQIDSLKR